MTVEEIEAAVGPLIRSVAWKFRHACRHVGCVGTDDLYSIGLEAVVRSWPRYRPSESRPTTWAYAVSRRAMWKAVRTHAYRRGLVGQRVRLRDGDGRADGGFAATDRADLIAWLAAKLDPVKRRVVAAVLEGKPHVDAARDLGMSRALFSFHYRAALGQMRGVMGDGN